MLFWKVYSWLWWCCFYGPNRGSWLFVWSLESIFYQFPEQNPRIGISVWFGKARKDRRPMRLRELRP